MVWHSTPCWPVRTSRYVGVLGMTLQLQERQSQSSVVGMRLTVVGCSGSIPGPDSPASCYLLEADGFRLVVDLGDGALAGCSGTRR